MGSRERRDGVPGLLRRWEARAMIQETVNQSGSNISYKKEEEEEEELANEHQRFFFFLI